MKTRGKGGGVTGAALYVLGHYKPRKSTEFWDSKESLLRDKWKERERD